MSAPSQNVANLSLGAAVDYTIDPTIPQSSQASVAQINDATKAHVALINATTKSGGRPRRRRRTSRRTYRGGVGGVGAATIPGDPTTIVVAPLPLGLNNANTEANNVAAAKLFANAVTASTYDNAVAKVGGGKSRRRTRRLSRKRTQRRRRTKRRSTKYRKMRKGARR